MDPLNTRPIQIEGQKDVDNLSQFSASHSDVQVKFINGTRKEMQALAEAQGGTKALVVAGMLAGAAAVVYGVGAALGVAATAAAFATPIGWAAAALAVVGLAIFAIQHYQLREAGMETRTGEKLKEALQASLCAALCTVTVLPALIGAGTIFDKPILSDRTRFETGFLEGSAWKGARPLILAQNLPTDANILKPKQQEEGEKSVLYVFKGDTYEVSDEGVKFSNPSGIGRTYGDRHAKPDYLEPTEGR